MLSWRWLYSGHGGVVVIAISWLHNGELVEYQKRKVHPSHHSTEVDVVIDVVDQRDGGNGSDVLVVMDVMPSWQLHRCRQYDVVAMVRGKFD